MGSIAVRKKIATSILAGKWLRYWWAYAKWGWHEPSPPVASFDNTPDKYQRSYLTREKWFAEKPQAPV